MNRRNNRNNNDEERPIVANTKLKRQNKTRATSSKIKTCSKTIVIKTLW